MCDFEDATAVDVVKEGSFDGLAQGLVDGGRDLRYVSVNTGRRRDWA